MFPSIRKKKKRKEGKHIQIFLLFKAIESWCCSLSLLFLINEMNVYTFHISFIEIMSTPFTRGFKKTETFTLVLYLLSFLQLSRCTFKSSSTTEEEIGTRKKGKDINITDKPIFRIRGVHA